MTDAVEILQRYVQKIPTSILGAEKVNFIIEMSQQMANDDKVLLHQLVNHILTLMVEREASDVEIGGLGTDDYIWFRVHGEKLRVEELKKIREVLERLDKKKN